MASRYLMPDFRTAYQLDDGETVEAIAYDGWLKTIRSITGRPLREVATKLQVAPSTLSRFERAELDGSITLANLRIYAEAMDCEVIYSLVPKTSYFSLAKARLLEINKDRRAMKKGRLYEPDSRAAETTWPRQTKFGVRR